ncbi:17279_t:CDS:10 [Dentiscutata heterogama]|uniref:17279_t:CDS:1 n=1 Tax=Dentiscutata heterogama TaxID=1316150 RepID=A0ACA9KRN8_9GLOM|nr:17279_t:CDS:10 [Dentiscutata heterogama]
MKILLYYLIFAIIICLLAILPTGFAQNTPLSLTNSLTSTNITHSEISIQPNLTGVQPRVLGIFHYQDSSTTVVRIARENYDVGIIRCFERRLLLRVIQANGSIIEINYDNLTEIQDINYCWVYVNNSNTLTPKQPLNIYPLFEQYILVTYTHATNTSDNTTFTDRGMVLDWGGNIISMLEFGPSYLSPGTNWYPNDFIVNNITPKKGFLRLSGIKVNNRSSAFEWRQYGYVGNGIFTLLSNDTVENLDLATTSFQVMVFPTLNDGYAIVYANSTNSVAISDPLSDLFNARAGIYAILLTYNQTRTSERIILYEISTPNISFTALYCFVDYVAIGHSCIVPVRRIVQGTSTTNVTYYNISTTTVTATRTTTLVSSSTTAVVGVPTQFPTQIPTPINVSIPVTNTTPTIMTSYIRIRFLSSGSVMTLNPLINITTSIQPMIRTLPLGGYTFILRPADNQNIDFSFALFDEANKPSTSVYLRQPILANLYGAFDVTRDNTLLIAQNETTTSWSLLSINLPALSPLKDNGYGNLHVTTTYPQRNSTDVTLNTNVISITFQEQISLTCDVNTKKCSTNNNTVSLEAFPSTFNDPSGQYFIQMDNNFVKSAIYNEPLLGIEPNIWTFQTAKNVSFKRSGDVQGKLLLTVAGSNQFKQLNDSGKYEFFTNLINELTVRIPISVGRLSTNGHTQLVNPWSDSEQILIPLFIKESSNNNEKLTIVARSDLDTLIKEKQFTGISTGAVTSLLDEKYGFQQLASLREFFEIHSTKIILYVVGLVLCLAIFIGARIKSPESDNFVILQLGIAIFKIVTITIFTFTDATTIQDLFIPSVVFLMLPIAVNLTLAFSILYSEHNEEFILWFKYHGRIATTVALLSGSNIDLLLILKSRLMKFKLFDAPLSNRSLSIIFWGGCADVILGDIEQLIIQIFYIYYTIEYDAIALFTIIASGLSTLSNIISKLFFIKYKKLSPYHKEEDKLGKSIKEPNVNRSIEQKENFDEPYVDKSVEQKETPEELGDNSEGTNVES